MFCYVENVFHMTLLPDSLVTTAGVAPGYISRHMPPSLLAPMESIMETFWYRLTQIHL